MDPKIWGRNMWTNMVHVAQAFPLNPTNQDRKNYQTFYLIIKDILPCYACRQNYARHLKELPVNTSSRNNLLQWLHQLHNKTLRQMKRSELTYEKFIQKYDNSQSSNSTSKSRLIFIFILLVVIFVVYYYYMDRINNYLARLM